MVKPVVTSVDGRKIRSDAFQVRVYEEIRMLAKPLSVFCLMIAVIACGQTSSELAAKYPVVAAYEVRPGILMTAQYAKDGQICEMVLETRHYRTPDEIDLSSTIPPGLIDQLTDEMVPASERGPATNRWLTNSHVAGGVSHVQRDFENVLIERDGSASTGDEIVIIRWKKRTCPTARLNSADSMKAHNRTDIVAPPAKMHDLQIVQPLTKAQRDRLLKVPAVEVSEGVIVTVSQPGEPPQQFIGQPIAAANPAPPRTVSEPVDSKMSSDAVQSKSTLSNTTTNMAVDSSNLRVPSYYPYPCLVRDPKTGKSVPGVCFHCSF